MTLFFYCLACKREFDDPGQIPFHGDWKDICPFCGSECFKELKPETDDGL